MPRWRFNLRNSRDLSKIGELTQARDKKLDLVLDKPGSAGFKHPMSTEYADAIKSYSTCISAERYNWRATKALWLSDPTRRGDLVWDWVWSGYIKDIDEDWHIDSMNINCVGWAERLGERWFRRKKLWIAMDDGAIVQDVLAEMNMNPAPDGYVVRTVAGSSPATPTWMAWGGLVPNEGPGGATVYVPRTHASINAPITLSKQPLTYAMSALDDITTLEWGGDWWVDPKTRLLYFARQRCAVLDDVVVAFRHGANNLSEFNRNISGGEKANYFLTTGGPTSIPQFAHNLADQDVVGLIEKMASLPDINNNSVLLANSGAEILIRPNGRITFGITPFSYQGNINKPVGSAPEPFVDYNIGDLIRVKARSPRGIRGSVNAQVRVFGMSVTIDENNNEKLGRLQVAP